MARVFKHYSEPLARYLRGGFGFSSSGGKRRFDGLRQRHELQDAVADTFRKAFEERARLGYSGVSPYSAYLKTIARNLVLDRLKSSRHKREVLDDPTDGLASKVDVDSQARGSTPASPQASYERSELSDLMARYVTDLGADVQRFVQLRYVEGKSQDEVAATLRRSRRWVRNAEVDVRRGLFRHLRGSGYLPHTASGGGRGA